MSSSSVTMTLAPGPEKKRKTSLRVIPPWERVNVNVRSPSTWSTDMIRLPTMFARRYCVKRWAFALFLRMMPVLQKCWLRVPVSK